MDRQNYDSQDRASIAASRGKNVNSEIRTKQFHVRVLRLLIYYWLRSFLAMYDLYLRDGECKQRKRSFSVNLVVKELCYTADA